MSIRDRALSTLLLTLSITGSAPPCRAETSSTADTAQARSNDERCEIVCSKPRQWRVSEFTFTGREQYSCQPLAVQLIATFHGPGGAVYRVPGFWDGDRTWKVRFMPDRPGKWTYETQAVEGETVIFDRLYDSGVMHGGESARRVDVDIRGLRELRLTVDGAGNGTSYDHADWADARVIEADGTSTWLETMKPDKARQGHGKLGLGTNVPGGKIRIAGRTFQHGLGTHATSELVYRLSDSAVRFQAWVGVDDVIGTQGSVRFCVIRKRLFTANVGRHDRGLDKQQKTFKAAPAKGTNPLFRHGGILRVSANRRHLTYTDGRPFFWLGDTWWFCPSDLMPVDGSSNPDIPSAYKQAIATRRRQGFTVVQMDFLDRIKGKSAYADFSQTRTVDIPFWRTVDRYFAIANAAGIIPVMGMGWKGQPMGIDEWKVLWRYVVARYGACGATLLICGEYNCEGVDTKQVAETLRLGQFIKSVDPWKRAMTIHPSYFRGDRKQAWKEPWYDFIMLQGGHGSAPPIDVYYNARKNMPVRPVLEGECAYEGIHTFTADDVRNRAWRAFQAGCFGYTYGSHGLWYPTQNEQDRHTKEWGKPTPWWSALKRPGAEQMGRMRAILETLSWWRLEPLPGAVSVDTGAAAAGKPVRKVIDLTARFEDAKSANVLWCKLIRHSWAADSLSEIELHPKHSSAATLTWHLLTLPTVQSGEALRLVLATGMDPGVNLKDSDHPSDGVTFSITVNGKELLRERRKSKKWTYHCLDLTEFAGRSVALTLATESGENSNWDHARFRAPIVVCADRDIKTPLRIAYTETMPKPVLVKADGKNTFLIYFPAIQGTTRPRLLLHAIVPGATYSATWHDPRTGTAHPADVIHCRDGNISITLPTPPDCRDWVLILRRH